MFRYQDHSWIMMKLKLTTAVKKTREKVVVYAAHAKDIAGWLGYEIKHSPRSFARWKEMKFSRECINQAAQYLTRMDESIRREEGMSMDDWDRKNAAYKYIGDFNSRHIIGPAPQLLEPTSDSEEKNSDEIKSTA